jgi:Fur family ferric uptake transcriptional regulator
VLQESRGPLAVPEIHALVEQQLGKVGIATVYRTLNLLQEEQQIAPLIMPTGEMRYEMAGLGHHVHFQCRVCRRVVDLQPSPTTLPRSITAPEHYLVEAFEVILYGLCPHCTP